MTDAAMKRPRVQMTNGQNRPMVQMTVAVMNRPRVQTTYAVKTDQGCRCLMLSKQTKGADY